ncbi:MAG TPA: CerR family C-terminal domain-containing protein [Phycisphaerae bacterium]|nr:CerR family C-terminal domain-containing protein [Phycisphaerae bacterium]
MLGITPTVPRMCHCATSVVGQCLHLYHARAVLTRLVPGMGYEPADIERWAEHIARFSIAGIRQCNGEDEAAA